MLVPMLVLVLVLVLVTFLGAPRALFLGELERARAQEWLLTLVLPEYWATSQLLLVLERLEPLPSLRSQALRVPMRSLLLVLVMVPNYQLLKWSLEWVLPVALLLVALVLIQAPMVLVLVVPVVPVVLVVLVVLVLEALPLLHPEWPSDRRYGR
jgi:hypothetical protein